MKWLAVVVAALSLISCEQLGVRDFPTAENAVTYNGVKYPIQKSVYWPQNGNYFYLDLAQTGIVIESGSVYPDPTVSRGFWLELSLYSNPAAPVTSGTFLVADESLANASVSTFDASGAQNVLFNDVPDSGGVRVTLTGSKLSVHGSILGSFYLGENPVTVPIRLDYDGPYETGEWP